jgi:hypothetical protein
MVWYGEQGEGGGALCEKEQYFGAWEERQRRFIRREYLHATVRFLPSIGHVSRHLEVRESPRSKGSTYRQCWFRRMEPVFGVLSNTIQYTACIASGGAIDRSS